ncbi:MAG: hypothetical protein EZS28_019164 [Streblomastix strix]|uniref:Enkurin domain-containing protein n=1 Tax=Streblomastix strix TaxID=222440 RepID=A0A5J4VRV4_9EUKA|nr:MAG: hypothetical protein EZS28_019164 [Streblomastix strix]
MIQNKVSDAERINSDLKRTLEDCQHVCDTLRHERDELKEEIGHIQQQLKSAQEQGVILQREKRSTIARIEDLETDQLMNQKLLREAADREKSFDNQLRTARQRIRELQREAFLAGQSSGLNGSFESDLLPSIQSSQTPPPHIVTPSPPTSAPASDFQLKIVQKPNQIKNQDSYANQHSINQFRNNQNMSSDSIKQALGMNQQSPFSQHPSISQSPDKINPFQSVGSPQLGNQQNYIDQQSNARRSRESHIQFGDPQREDGSKMPLVIHPPSQMQSSFSTDPNSSDSDVRTQSNQQLRERQMELSQITSELNRLPSSSSNMRQRQRKEEINNRTEQLEKEINQIKMQLRKLNEKHL